MKAENEPKKAGACRHDHPVRSEWKICLLVAPSRRAGISHSDPSYSGVTSHTPARTRPPARTGARTLPGWKKTFFEIYVTADSHLQKALLLTNVALWWPRRFNCFLMLHTFRSAPPPPSFFNLNFLPKSPKVEHML